MSRGEPIKVKSEEAIMDGFTESELHAAFSLVQNEENWKLPIDKIVDVPSNGEQAARLINAIKRATVYYAGSPASVEYWGDGNRVRVRAAGYYACIGA